MLASLDRRLRGEGSQAWHRGPAVRDRTGMAQLQGMLAFTAAASVLSTSATLPRLRFRFRFLFWRRWRFPFLRRKILPEAVILNRLETDFLVLARPAFLDIGAERIRGTGPCARKFLGWGDVSRGLCRALFTWDLDQREGAIVLSRQFWRPRSARARRLSDVKWLPLHSDLHDPGMNPVS